eukprot:g1510.t1
MPAYHSSFNDKETEFKQACSVSLLPLRTSVRGPAPKLAEDEKKDVIDECLTFFRANMFFSNFDVKGGSDRLLIYLTLYAAQCIKRCQKVTTKQEGEKVLYNLANESFAIPGQSGWKLGGFFAAPKTAKEGEILRSYLKQAREELSARIAPKLYTEDGEQNKWWMQYGKRDFMGIKLH